MKHLLISILLLGCGPNLYEDPSDHRRTIVTNVEYQDQYKDITIQSNYGDYQVYVEEFKTLVEQHTGIYPEDKVTDISFRPNSIGNVWATCKTYVREVNGNYYIVQASIEIDPNMKDQPEILFKTVLFHELGHCIINSDHVLNRQDLMYPYTQENITEKTSDEKIDTYMERLAKGEY